MRIKKIGIVGAGTRGSGIAALAVSAGLPVVLLDIPGPATDRNGPTRAGLERTKKSKPAAFMDVARAQFIQTGNTEDHLEWLADCDLVIEAIIEQLAPKRDLYARPEPLLASDAIVASNTSGIPIAELAAERTPEFRSRFLGMHFFNPPRYLHLLEIIPTAETSKSTISAVRRFSDRILGKGIIVAKDVSGFVANRLGVYGMVLAIRLMEKHGLTIDEADALTGVLSGRSKSATFRTADLSGIDVIAHVTRELGDATGEDFALPAWVLELVKKGQVGEKSGAGFYKRVGKEIHTLDWRTGAYAPQAKPSSEELKKINAMPLRERFAALTVWRGREGDFVREYLLRFSHYVLAKTPIVAYDIPSVDHAMEWGYAWEAGPFEQMDLLGPAFLRDGFRELGLEEPPLFERANDGFYRYGGTSVLTLDGAYGPVQTELDVVSLTTTATAPAGSKKLEKTDDATLWSIGGVAMLEYHRKMNTDGKGVIHMTEQALDRVERDGLAGLGLGHEA